MSDQTHDKFFKVLFSDKKMAIEYFEQFLPTELVELLVWDQLKIMKDSYINKELKGRFSDIVYSCPIKGEEESIQVCLLLEHKSQKEDYPHFQLLRYLLNGWELQAQQKKVLTPIIPILFYHGESPWKVRPLKDYFPYTNAIIDSYIPAFDYHLTDLTQFSDESILKLRTSFLINALLTLKHARELNFLTEFVDLILNMKGEPTPFLRDAFFVYFIRISKLSKIEMEQAREKLTEPAKEAFTSTYDMILNEGMEKGIERGIIGLLKKKMSVAFIAEAFEVSKEYVLEIKGRLDL